MSLDDALSLRFAEITEEIRGLYGADDDDEWSSSPFGWIKTKASRTVGAIGEKLVAAWCDDLGLDVVRTGDTEADRLVEGHRVEIKFSTRWQNGEYRFQQIRDQRYDFLFALGLSPSSVHGWMIPKSVLLEHVIGQMGQHTGAGAADTDWLAVVPGEEPPWLRACGGSLGDVTVILETLRRPVRD
ncbi:MAG: hypothetical protein OXH86_18340 [Acidimicrobiaceae bacterium]|nr:hypothetical protein [Acidimicrobiaceae bacterium]MDE0320443.1 hypothetical protein [Acidimicrobiaceae bacterium]MDE0499301.1 hypothetical protein [Acidimicrobiaceae bacterium]